MNTHELIRLTDDLTEVVARSPHNRRRFNHIHYIINTIAGGVARRGRFHASHDAIRAWLARNAKDAADGVSPADDTSGASGAPAASGISATSGGSGASGTASAVDVSGSPPTRSVHLTEHPGHASDIAASILDNPESERQLIVSIGGDGTHREVLSAVAERVDVKVGANGRNVCVFRMPMGTGNDGADAVDAADACRQLHFGVPVNNTGIVRVTPTGMRPMFAFNVTSIGIDAYVTDTSNKLKAAFPGDMYKVIADAATLFYEPVFGVGEVGLTLTDDDGVESRYQDRYILVAVGPTGHRHYGNGKRILPSDANLCAIRTVGLLKKIAMKKHVYEGSHVGLPGTLSACVTKVVVEYQRRVPLQLDGEGVWLEPQNFPLTFERVDSAITVLHAGGA